ncbi:MAG: Gfo/Idh/MocA family oxidoreductase [Gomphosphaeria aponina SAG 52.96 = DSM 107014]|uniref:Gfo/Idh/MocA family oxidoreductase n=1 Tax=Gomphosphaeria aponina SAG 52.96 = DSM 107014 TaxID=1521640 RepID=A0A941GRK2_9CHRO|nr:Gfo/Idh/MocA family oxidoreductase [Gomphosphaeria aponina SAG 52.96 = DSM 107014]
MKTRIAILGVGRWGTNLMRNFLAHPQAEIVAIIDISPEKLARCQQQFGLDESQVTYTTEWEKVREQKNIDGVVVATPACTHYFLIADALQGGYHVLAEKPLALAPAECLALTRLAAINQRHLFVDHTYLFHSVVTKGKQIINAGKLGELRYGYASRTNLGPVRQDVDVLWDLAIHDIGIFNYWLGENPIAVEATGKVWLQQDQSLADLVWVTLIYESGFQADIHLCWLNPDKQRKLAVVGSQGSLIFDELSTDTPLVFQGGYFVREGKNFIPVAQMREVIEIETRETLWTVCDRFLANIHTQKPSVSAGLLAAQLVQILTCLTQSLQQQGKRIFVPQLTINH